MSKTYLWIEDREGKASYTFWKSLLTHLFPEVILESKKNNSELVKSVTELKDEKNTYIIVFDNSFDNLCVYQELKRLKQCVAAKNNVKLMNIICFEYILLEFDKLFQWIYAENDDFWSKRSKAIDARNKLVTALNSGEMEYKLLREVVEYDTKIESHNIEQLATKLLFDLTRNTGFEVSKGKLGDCWFKSCCEWEEKEDNDVCGLSIAPLHNSEKMKSIYLGTSLHAKITEVGLEASVC